MFCDADIFLTLAALNFSEKTQKYVCVSHHSSALIYRKFLKFNSLWPSDAIRRHRSRSTLAHVTACCQAAPGGRFNKKISSYQHKKSHCGDKTILRPSYLHNGISYTDKMTSLYWIRAQDINWSSESRIRTDVDPSSMWLCGTHLRLISHKVLQISICKMCLTQWAKQM